MRAVKEGEVTADLFTFLTMDPNVEVGAIHPKAMPAILTTTEELEFWMTAHMQAVARWGTDSCLARRRQDPPEAVEAPPAQAQPSLI